MVNASMATPPSGQDGQSPLPALTPELRERMTPYILILRVINWFIEAGLIPRDEATWAYRLSYAQMYADIRAFDSSSISRKRCR